MKKRLLSMLLVLAMVIGILPTAALAASNKTDVKFRKVVEGLSPDYVPGDTDHDDIEFKFTLVDPDGHSSDDDSFDFELEKKNDGFDDFSYDKDTGVFTSLDKETETEKMYVRETYTLTEKVEYPTGYNGPRDYELTLVADPADNAKLEKNEADNSWTIVVTGAVTITAYNNYSPKQTYTLTYDVNGGVDGPAPQTESSSTGSCSFTVSNTKPTRGDLHFMGWADSANETTANYQPGSTITLYQANPTKTIYAVWGGHEDAGGDGLCDNGRECLHGHDGEGYCTVGGCTHPHGANGCCPLRPQPPGKPTENDVGMLLASGAVKVDCTNGDVSHADKTYGLLTGSYTIGDVESDATGGYTCTITVTPDAYVALYNEEISANHTLDPERQTGTITLHYVPDPSNPDGTVSTWQVKSGVPVTFTVDCETPEPEKPATPTDEQLIKLLAGKITVDCVNTEIDPEHDNKTYGLLTDSYEIGDVTGNKTDGYFCNVTIKPATYVAEYNKTLPGHTAAAGETDKTIRLNYGGSGDGFFWTPDPASVTFNVVCETPEEDPEKPTDEDLSNILRGSFVTVECISTNDHSSKSLSYGLLLGGYTIGEVKDNAEDGYTCEVTFYADVYQAKYNDDTTSKHELYPQEQQPVSIVLTWNGEKWTAPDGYAVHFTVTCDGDSSYYTVTYADGVDGVVVFADQTYYVRAGEKTPAFVGTPTRPGYRFVGWAPAVTETVTGSVTYTAQWRRSYHPTTPAETKPKLNKADHYAYVVGYPDGTVQPQGAITRAEVATIFFRLLSDETRDLYWTKSNAYTDVKAGDWFNNAVSTLSNAGIINGYPDGTFRPNAPITRAEMAKVIAMFAELDKDSEGFKDIAGHWAEAYIKLAAGNGWIAGYPDGTFRPDQDITRAETMTMINRVLERVPSEEEHLLSRRVMLTFPDNQPGDWYYIAVQEATNSHTYERYATEKNGDEQWIKLIDNYDWTKLEF